MVRLPAGVTYRQFDHWCSKGYIKGADKPGTGNPREITTEEEEVLHLAARLIDFGFRVDKAFVKARLLLQHQSIEMVNVKLNLIS